MMKEGDFSNRDVDTTKNEVDFWLNDFNDLFSDFDHRPYLERSLSDDFLSEAKRACQYKDSENLKLKIFLPKKLRDKNDERVVKKRLIEHFEKHSHLLEKEHIHDFVKGIVTTIIGVVTMILVTTFLYKYSDYNDTLNTIIAVAEIAGWFLVWTGLNNIIFESRTKNPNLEFYKKMSKASIIFYDSN